jgi:hypothetical protein
MKLLPPMRPVTDQIRGGVMWFGILLVVFTVMLTYAFSRSRIDSPEEFVSALRQDRVNAVPLAFAVFIVIATLPRPSLLKRVALAIVVGAVCWFFTWRYLVHCDYMQLQFSGINPAQALKIAKP